MHSTLKIFQSSIYNVNIDAKSAHIDAKTIEFVDSYIVVCSSLIAPENSSFFIND